ncbi:hypothetical protein HCN44_000901 [Aphidius gifuensis]|uniref:LisH domain-containing protein n=1 Tax=Aphidius gifuensis TaxID=684658 RepID=A0A834XL84_APHGI|nr:hypothetical protein HCN44_000901 [Aphidius gifuensis]
MATAESLSEVTDVVQILKQWEEEHGITTYDPIPTLERLAEIIELEKENYYKMDPDPFDERHPSRAYPDCNFGHILKVLFRKDSFITKLINDYLRDTFYRGSGIDRDVRLLNIAACRLVLDILPGLETSAVFQPDMESLILRLYSWAENSHEPLQSYATGLLAAAMEVQDIATSFREQNAHLIPLMLQRLHVLQSTAEEERQCSINPRPFAHVGSNRNGTCSSQIHHDTNEHKLSTPIKRKISDVKIDNNVKKHPNELFPIDDTDGGGGGGGSNGASVNIIDNHDDNAVNNIDDTPPSKKTKKTNDNNVKNNTESSDMMSPPLSIPKIQNSNNHNSNNNNLLNNHHDNNTPTKNTRSTPPRQTPTPTKLNLNNTSTPTTTTTTTPSATTTIVNRQLQRSSTPSMLLEGNSNSSWAELETYVIGSVQIYPPTLATRQMLILRYLAPMGEYQEFLGPVFEHNALELILKYINVRKTKDSRLAFEALKYLASLLVHKKFSLEFLNMSGLQKLLDVPRPSVAATGVSICLYYLTYCEDAMERVCLLPEQIVKELVTYVLWLLETSHDSGRCHGTMFFGFSFPFKVILDEFDSQGGLRILLNVISTLKILNFEEQDIQSINDDEDNAARQIVRHVVTALKRYMEAHLYWKSEQLQRLENARNDQDNRHQYLIPPYKPCKLRSDEVQSKVELLQELMNVRTPWQPVQQLYNLQGINLLLRIIAISREWNFSGRATFSAETVKCCFDVIAICSVVPKVLLLLCDRIDIPDMSMTIAINLLLAAAEGEIIQDPDVQRAALRALINCVCSPINRVGGNVGRYSISGSAKKKTIHNSEELIQKIWESVRSNNGIMMLLGLMSVKVPITDADSIRALACRALAGLARSEKVRQIISKLPMFTTGHIQSLMKDPILQEKRQEHVTFQKYALELMERVSGKAKPSGAEYEMTLASLHRANVVAQTRIQYNDHDLNLLIHQHLVSKGLIDTAMTLQKEACLESTLVPQKLLPYQPIPYKSLVPNIRANSSQVSSSLSSSHYNTPKVSRGDCSAASSSSRTNLLQSPLSTPSRYINNPTTATAAAAIGTTAAGTTSTPMRISKLSDSCCQTPPPLAPQASTSIINNNNTSLLSSSSSSIKLQTTNPKKIIINEKKSTTTPLSNIDNNNSTLNSLISSTPTSRLEKPTAREIAAISGVVGGGGGCVSSNLTTLSSTNYNTTISLNSIIKEYLTNQHALCKNPMVTCPQFNLLEPHKCPDPRTKNSTPINMSVRLGRRQFGMDSRRLDRKHIYSRFCPVKTFKPTEAEGGFTYCIFTPCQQFLMLGTQPGDVKMFNIHSGVEEVTYQCHESYIKYMEMNQTGELLLTNTEWRAPLSALWSCGSFFEMRVSFENESHVEFSKHQDKIIGTQQDKSTIYDVTTGALIKELIPSISNQYIENRATFSMNDELVLSDGILWDVNSGKEIHKFDKLNQTLNGVFHPNGIEVVSNTEVWDLRTFHLLNTVPTLEKMNVLFSPINNILYAISCDEDGDDETSYLTSFKTLDANDYSSIATYDVKRVIPSLAINKFDTQIAIVENYGTHDGPVDSHVRIYDVGRKRDDDDEEVDEDDEDDLDASDDDGSNSGSDDNIVEGK